MRRRHRQQLIKNIRQVNASQDLEFQVALESLVGSMNTPSVESAYEANRSPSSKEKKRVVTEPIHAPKDAAVPGIDFDSLLGDPAPTRSRLRHWRSRSRPVTPAGRCRVHGVQAHILLPYLLTEQQWADLRKLGPGRRGADDHRPQRDHQLRRAGAGEAHAPPAVNCSTRRRTSRSPRPRRSSTTCCARSTASPRSGATRSSRTPSTRSPSGSAAQVLAQRAGARGEADRREDRPRRDQAQGDGAQARRQRHAWAARCTRTPRPRWRASWRCWPRSSRSPIALSAVRRCRCRAQGGRRPGRRTGCRRAVDYGGRRSRLNELREIHSNLAGAGSPNSRRPGSTGVSSSSSATRKRRPSAT